MVVGRPTIPSFDFMRERGRKIGGLLDWSTQASPGTKKGRETPIELNRSYELNWRDYSTVPQKRNNRYWEVPAGGRRETNDSQFRLHEGRKIGGLLDWSTQASPGTKKGRETPIELNRSYELNWRDYSTVPQKRNNRFRFLSVYVPR